MNLHMYDGRETSILDFQAETYEDIKRFVMDIENNGVFNKPFEETTTADMAAAGWYKNEVFIGWFNPKFTEVKGQRVYQPCLSFYLQKPA